jgi:hypothetical protein
VQYVIRPNLDFRGFAGQISSGTIRRGDPVTVLPSGQASRVRSIVTWEGEIDEAAAPMSVTICLENEIDVSRGDMLVQSGRLPEVSRAVDATVVWMNEKPLAPQRPYLLKHTTQMVQARVQQIRARVDVNTLSEGPASSLGLNEIGRIHIEAQRPLFCDPYRRNRATGSFILIDPLTNETAGAGMILGRADGWETRGRVTSADRAARHGHSSEIVMLPPGRHELAYALERLLFDMGWTVHVIEHAENLRQAMRTAWSAGLASIVVPEEGQEIEPGLPMIRPAIADADAPGAAEEIARALGEPGSVTGGAGI